MKLRSYKGFEGTVTDIDLETNTLTAEAINVDAAIHAQAETAAELQREWEASVDTYLEVCAERGIEPMKPFSGVLSLRLGAELHRDAYVAARLAGTSLNAWIKDLVTSQAHALAAMPQAGIKGPEEVIVLTADSPPKRAPTRGRRARQPQPGA